MKNNHELDIKIDYSFLSKKWSNYIKKSEIYQLIVSCILVAENIEINRKFALSLLFADNNMVKNVNKNFRNKDKETNVISLVANDFSKKDIKFAMVGEFLMLGDIVFALEYIENEAREQNKTFKNHLSHLIVHSTLHLLGYDHEDDKGATKMENLEIDILAKFGISSPYII